MVSTCRPHLAHLSLVAVQSYQSFLLNYISSAPDNSRRRKEKSYGYPSRKKGSFLDLAPLARPFHCLALSSFLQFRPARVHRYPVLLLVPTSLDHHHCHHNWGTLRAGSLI